MVITSVGRYAFYNYDESADLRGAKPVYDVGKVEFRTADPPSSNSFVNGSFKGVNGDIVSTGSPTGFGKIYIQRDWVGIEYLDAPTHNHSFSLVIDGVTSVDHPDEILPLENMSTPESRMVKVLPTAMIPFSNRVTAQYPDNINFSGVRAKYLARKDGKCIAAFEVQPTIVNSMCWPSTVEMEDFYALGLTLYRDSDADVSILSEVDGLIFNNATSNAAKKVLTVIRNVEPLTIATGDFPTFLTPTSDAYNINSVVVSVITAKTFLHHNEVNVNNEQRKLVRDGLIFPYQVMKELLLSKVSVSQDAQLLTSFDVFLTIDDDFSKLLSEYNEAYADAKVETIKTTYASMYQLLGGLTTKIGEYVKEQSSDILKNHFNQAIGPYFHHTNSNLDNLVATMPIKVNDLSESFEAIPTNGQNSLRDIVEVVALDYHPTNVFKTSDASVFGDQWRQLVDAKMLEYLSPFSSNLSVIASAFENGFGDMSTWVDKMCSVKWLFWEEDYPSYTGVDSKRNLILANEMVYKDGKLVIVCTSRPVISAHHKIKIPDLERDVKDLVLNMFPIAQYHTKFRGWTAADNENLLNIVLSVFSWGRDRHYNTPRLIFEIEISAPLDPMTFIPSQDMMNTKAADLCLLQTDVTAIESAYAYIESALDDIVKIASLSCYGRVESSFMPLHHASLVSNVTHEYLDSIKNLIDLVKDLNPTIDTELDNFLIRLTYAITSAQSPIMWLDEISVLSALRTTSLNACPFYLFFNPGGANV